MFKTRFISMLVLLMSAVTGAWAQEQSETIVTTDKIVEGTHFTISNNDGWADWDGMYADGGITVTSKNGETITKVVISCTYEPGRVNDGNTSVSSGTKEITNGGETITVTGVNASTFTFTCSDPGPQFGQFVVYYTEASTVAVTGVTLAPTSATLTLGETETVTLIPTVLPAEATDKSVTWSSSDEAVATVTDGVVTAVAAGTATITVTTTDGAKTATCAVTVAAPAASTYTVTLKEGTEDANKWEIAPAEATTTGVAAGTEVKATYGGTKKVKSVKAKKKAAPAPARTLAEATAEDIGKLIGADGNIYDDAAAATAASTTAVAMIAYVGNDAETSTTYNHGLALALGDVSDTKNWCSQTEATCLGTGHQFDSEAGAKGDMAGIDNTDALVNNTGHAHDAASAARGYNSGTHPAGTSAWFLPSAGQWDKMAAAAGSYANLIANAGLQGWGAAYWSSTEGGAEYAWLFDSSNGKLDGYGKDYDFQVRACLAF